MVRLVIVRAKTQLRCQRCFHGTLFVAISLSLPASKISAKSHYRREKNSTANPRGNVRDSQGATHGTPNRPAVANCLRVSDTQPYSLPGRQTSASSSSLLLRLSIRRAASRLASIQTRRRRRRGTKDADLMPLAVLMRWLQLRFDFDSTAVRLLIKGHEGHSDVTCHSQSR